MAGAHTEKVHFRLIVMPCCGQHLCWVNPRLPTCCPECGERVLVRLRMDGSKIAVSDPKAELKYHA